MPTLLRYDLTTVSPETGNLNQVTLIVVASNPDPSTPVALQGLIISFPVGPNATDLTTDDKDIGPVSPAGWKPADTNQSTGKVSYTFYPDKGEYQVKDGGLSFVFNNVELNSQSGTVAIEVMEGSGGCTPPDCPTQQLSITKFQNGWGAVAFSVEPADVPQGGATTLHWSGPDKATYTIEYYDPQRNEIVQVPQTGGVALSNTGKYPSDTDAPLTLSQTTTFTLTVEKTIEGQSYQAQVQKTVTVDIPRQLAITKFECSTVDFSATGFTLRWQVQMADSCTLEVDGVSGRVTVDAVDDFSGAWNSCQVRSDDGTTLIFSKADGSGVELERITLPTPVPESAIFRLTAATDSEVAQQTFAGNLLRPQLIEFDVNNEITYESAISALQLTYNFSWQTAHANVSITPGVGPVAGSGSTTYNNSPFGKVQFTIVCIGFGETSSQTIKSDAELGL